MASDVQADTTVDSSTDLTSEVPTWYEQSTEAADTSVMTTTTTIISTTTVNSNLIN